MRMPRNVDGHQATESYKVAKGILLREVQERYEPDELAHSPEYLKVYRSLDRRSAALRLSMRLLLEEEAYPFTMKVRLPVKHGLLLPEMEAELRIPHPVLREAVAELEPLDRKAIADKLVAGLYHEIGELLTLGRDFMPRPARQDYLTQRGQLTKTYARLTDDLDEAA